MEMRNLQDCDVVSAFISKDAFIKAPADESGTNKDLPEKMQGEYEMNVVINLQARFYLYFIFY